LTLLKFILTIAIVVYTIYLRLTEGTAGMWVFPMIVALLWIMIHLTYPLEVYHRYKRIQMKKRIRNAKKDSTN